ncbi:hypothetical protein VTN02DRAFT_2393 [Thermoascus thermophilus]
MRLSFCQHQQTGSPSSLICHYACSLEGLGINTSLHPCQKCSPSRIPQPTLLSESRATHVWRYSFLCSRDCFDLVVSIGILAHGWRVFSFPKHSRHSRETTEALSKKGSPHVGSPAGVRICPTDSQSQIHEVPTDTWRSKSRPFLSRARSRGYGDLGFIRARRS